MAVDDIELGDEILAEWGAAVATFLNDVTTLVAATGNIGTSETQVIGATIPADSLIAGTTYRVIAYGTAANSSGADRALTLRVRIGDTTLTGNIAGTRAPNIKDGAAGEGFRVEALFTVRTDGATGTCIASMDHASGPSQPLNTNAFVSNDTSTVVVNTTQENVLELTAVTANAGATVNFRTAIIKRETP